MGLLCGRKCECRRRCKSYFSDMPDVERGCIKACSDNRDLSREDYLCSGQYIDQQQFMLSYGYDPCPNDGITMPDVLDPTNSFERGQKNISQLMPVFLGIGLVVVIGIIALAWAVKR